MTVSIVCGFIYVQIWTKISSIWCLQYVRQEKLKEQPQDLHNVFIQIRSVAQSCPTLCDPMNRSTPGLPVHHQLTEFTQTHVHWVSDPIQPYHPLLSPSPPASNPSQHQSLFQWVNSSHEVAKVLEFQLQHHSFQRTFNTVLFCRIIFVCYKYIQHILIWKL